MMDNSILLGKYILMIMKADAQLMEMIDEDSIYAVIAHDKAVQPYIVYNTSLTVEYTKDNFGAVGHSNNAVIAIDVYAPKYSQCAELANEVRAALEGKGYRDSDIYIDRMRITNIDSGYDDQYGPCFRYSLIFNTIVE